MGSHCQKMTQISKEASRPIVYCADFSRQEMSSPRRASRPLISKVPPRQQTTRSILAYNQLCIYAAVCDWFDRNNRNQAAHRRECREHSKEDLTNLAHRKYVTASGNRMRDNEENLKTIAQVSQGAGFSAKVGKGQCFVTRPSIKSSEGSTFAC